jgi:hypothetical protein
MSQSCSTRPSLRLCAEASATRSFPAFQPCMHTCLTPPPPTLSHPPACWSHCQAPWPCQPARTGRTHTPEACWATGITTPALQGSGCGPHSPGACTSSSSHAGLTGSLASIVCCWPKHKPARLCLSCPVANKKRAWELAVCCWQTEGLLRQSP